MAHPTIFEEVKPIWEYRMDNSTPQIETDVLILGDKVYGIKVDKYMVKYKEVIANKISWVELNAKI